MGSGVARTTTLASERCGFDCLTADTRRAVTKDLAHNKETFMAASNLGLLEARWKGGRYVIG